MKVSSIFSDGAVFQHGKEIVVFGEGNGTFRAEFLGETVETIAKGKFKVCFSAHPAGGPYEMKMWLNGEEKVIRNLQIGEVIFLGGQSNAELKITETDDKDTLFEANDLIRYFYNTSPSMDGNGNFLEVDPKGDGWVSLTKENAKMWSAIALHTARYYAEKKKVAVGVVTCFKGASNIQAFLSEERNDAFPLEPEKLHRDATVYKWNFNACLYHRMVEKVSAYQTASAIWYQGESNRTVYEAGYYADMLVSLVDMLRKENGDLNLPFAVVQINDHPYPGSDEGVAAIQAAQEKAVAKMHDCRLIKINDMGQAENIHPTNKREVSQRICAALDDMQKN